MESTQIIERDWLFGAPSAIPHAVMCAAVGCRKVVMATGFCAMHYKRRQRHGHLKTTRPDDWGTRESHPLYRYWTTLRRNFNGDLGEWYDDFWAFADYVKEKPSPHHMLARLEISKPYGPNNVAWTTNKNEYRANWREKETSHQNMRRRDAGWEFEKNVSSAGISIDQYDSIFENQNGKCAICLRGECRVSVKTMRPYKLAVDHCHKTGIIRGLLCSMCNHALGHMDDDPELLIRAAEYLKNPPAAAHNFVYRGRHKRRARPRDPSPHGSIKE